jgi:hypothetical protein
MKRYRMSLVASRFFTVEATSDEEAIAEAGELARHLPFGEGEAVSADPDYYTSLPEAEVVFYLDTDSEPEIEDVEEI